MGWVGDLLKSIRGLGTVLVANDYTNPYNPPPRSASDVDPPVRRGGVRPQKRTKNRPRTSPLPTNITRWYQSDVEKAILQASSGDIQGIAQIYRCFSRDGRLKGLLSTRTNGLVRLPKTWRGTTRAVEALEGREGRPGAFARIFPDAELARIDADGEVLGVGLGEFVQAEGDTHYTLVRLDPEFLIYRWHEDRWYYRSLEGLIPITPGDGRFVLHLPHGRYEPWNEGSVQALGRAYISKEHNFFMRDNYSGKLANPARVAISPQGAAEEQKQSWFAKVMAWGKNTVFGMTPGYDVKLLELKGEGYKVFAEGINTSDEEFAIILCGQLVTVTGGVGFANANVFATIRSDLIQGDGNSLANTLNTQAIPHVVYDLTDGAEGEEAAMAWDTRPPADMKVGAESLQAAAKAIDDCTAACDKHGLIFDAGAVCALYNVPARRKDGKPVSAHVEQAAPGGTRTVDLDVIQQAVEVAQLAGLEPDKQSLTELIGSTGLKVGSPSLATTTPAPSVQEAA